MASNENRHIFAKLVISLLVLSILDFSVAQTGVCYGMIGTGLPSPANAIAIFNQYNIRRIRMYYPHAPTLQALGGSNIELMLDVPNTDLQNVAASQANAITWVQNNVRNYGNVRFRYIIVGNEVSPIRGESSQYVNFIIPALNNIYNAIQQAGLGNQIRVSTALDTGLLGNSYPPADGAFSGNVVSYVEPIIQFLVRTSAPLMVNIYPYFSHIGNPAQVSLEYALGTGNGVVVPGGTRYQNLFYAMLDAMYAAVGRIQGGSALEIVVSESGWPSAGGTATSIDNARTYNNNLIQWVRSGTPTRAGRAIEAYVYAMFDQDQRNPEYERFFGMFQASGQAKYPINF